MAAALVLSACASSHIIVGTVRPKIDPSQVKLYLEPPAEYEEIALLEASSDDSWAITQQGQTIAVIDHFKHEAASPGANGVLIASVGQRQMGSVGTGTAVHAGNTATATGISTGIFDTHGIAIAIYVPPSSK